MNKVSVTDVGFLSLAILDFSAVTDYLKVHDYPVAGGFLVVGIILAYCYHKFGSAVV